jgi:predicted amidohydrolase
MAKLRIATAQFPVSTKIARNFDYIAELTARAKKEKADIAHFSETCLGGYAGSEFNSWDNYDWDSLKAAEADLQQLAKDLKIGMVYGTNHRASRNDMRNSLVYVSNKGERVGRYDKRFCTGGDLKFYNAGSVLSPLILMASSADC